MARGRHKLLLDRSIAAALSAIEVYNKPTFQYRDETFAILMVNAWELLLKARILQLNNNNFNAICAMEYRKLRDGKKSKRKYPKVNRSGNKMTIALRRAIAVLRDYPHQELPDEVAENVALLEEVRDNSIHYRNEHLGLSAKVQEIGIAALRNYVKLAHSWFQCDLSKYNFYLMPMTFHNESDVVESFSVHPPNKQMQNMLTYLARVYDKFPSGEDREYNIALKIETRFVKAGSMDALKVQFTKDPNAPQITVTEEEVLKRFPLDYAALTARLRSRYVNFKVDKEYHKYRKDLESQERLCRVRLLDPENPSSQKKCFYSTEIIKEFDKIYTRKDGRDGR